MVTLPAAVFLTTLADNGAINYRRTRCIVQKFLLMLVCIAILFAHQI